MHKHISSAQNSAVKRLLQLQEKSRTRKKEGGFIIEGLREIGLAVSGQYMITELYIKEGYTEDVSIKKLINALQDASVTILSEEVYRKIAYRDGTESVIAFAKAKNTSLQELLAVSYTHLRAHETVLDLVCRLLLEKKKISKKIDYIPL